MTSHEQNANVTSPALLSRLEEALTSLGAALGANDATNIARQLRAAADLGASRSQLQQAIDTAHGVQQNAAQIHLHEAQRLLDEVATRAATAATTASHRDEGCGCGADDQTQEAPVTAEKPVAASGGHAAGCGGMATRFAASDAPEAVAGCREMFERFMPAAAPAKTDKTPAATTAAGACNKEAWK